MDRSEGLENGWTLGKAQILMEILRPALFQPPRAGVLSAMAQGHDEVATALSEAARKALPMIPEGYQYQTPLIRESIELGQNGEPPHSDPQLH